MSSFQQNKGKANPGHYKDKPNPSIEKQPTKNPKDNKPWSGSCGCK